MEHEWWDKLNLTSLLTESVKDKKQILLISKMLFLYGKKSPLLFLMNKILSRRSFFPLWELELLHRYFMCHFLLKCLITLNKHSIVAVAHSDHSLYNFIFVMLLCFWVFFKFTSSNLWDITVEIKERIVLPVLKLKLLHS